MMAVSPEEALEAQEAAKANEGATDRGDDFLPDEETTSERDDGAADEPEVKPTTAKADEADEDPETAEPEAASAEVEEDDEPEEPAPVRGIPKHRFDASQAARRRAEEEVQRLKQQLAEGAKDAPPKDVPISQQELDAKQAELDDQIAKATLDGDAEVVRKLTAQSRAMEREFLRNEAQNMATRQSNAAMQRIKLDETISMLESEYPEMDPDSDKYNDEIVNEVLDLQEALVRGGKYNAPDAMLRAVGYVMKGVEHESPEPKKPAKRKTDVKKNVEASKKQPPSLEGVGTDSDKSGMTGTPDPDKLTEDEFAALPETTRKRMRGDFV